MDERSGRQSEWLVVVVRVPSEPSRHRVATWRELRRGGAVQLSPGTWAMPDRPPFTDTLQRVAAAVAQGKGEMTTLRVTGADPADTERLRVAFQAARDDEWAELARDCDKLVAEIDDEIAKGKLTLAELEEEEQSLDRLRRWSRILRSRDVFGSPRRAEAEDRLTACAERLAQFEQQVFDALETPP
jgi:ChrB-like protein